MLDLLPQRRTQMQPKLELECARESQLSIIQKAINEEMVRLNNMIYDGEGYATDITFEST